MTVFDLPATETRIETLLTQAAEPEFWNREDAQETTRELAQLQQKREAWEALHRELQELETLAALLAEEEDGDLQAEFYRRGESFEKELERRQIVTLLDEEYDRSDAIITIHAGAGGLDSQDWAEILSRMYLRWVEKEGFKSRILDQLADQEAGIKSITFEVKGEYAYGYLKGEKGVHRLVRISPFDAAKRRHTSFSSVEVMPVLPEDADIEIRPEDLKMDTFRSSGAGGQYVNMTDSAVRITHVPSGIIVSCQVERSQHMNRATALQVLKAKLFERQLQERQEHLESLQGEKRSIAWGSQIRSYTLQPFQLVKDHRSGCEVGNVAAVLDGDLEELIMAFLRFSKTGRTADRGGSGS